jgi:uncharacterized membrane protein
MITPASIAGHPLHPMLVTVPIGLWVFSLVADLIALGGGGALWPGLAFYTLLGGAIGAMVAAVPGLIDFKFVLERHGARAGRIVTLHLTLNLVIVCLVALNLLLRAFTNAGSWGVGISVLTIAALGVSGWLGGELVHVLGVSTPYGEARETAPSTPGVARSDRQGRPRHATPRTQ